MKNNSKIVVHLVVSAFLAGLYLISGAGQVALGASFDCTKASTDVEKYICAHEGISRLDEILSEVYSGKMKSLSASEQIALKKEQRAWMKSRDNCLGYLPMEESNCMYDKYKNRIIELGGIEKLIALYKEYCADNEWSCEAVGDLLLAQGKLEEAAKYYDIMCVIDRDGDYGENCYKKAAVLEQLGKTEEAKALYIKTCQNREHNEACAAAQRLTSTIEPNDHWSGLYRSDTGTLFIKKISDGKYEFNFDTAWANGHLCSYKSTFALKDGEAVVPADEDYPECKPEIVKHDSAIEIKDPTRQCQRLCGARASFEEIFYKE